jgi:cell wall-associated NlpC family hydrolase
MFSVVAATAVGAGAAATMTGSIPAVQVTPTPDVSDTQAFARPVVHPVALTGAPAAATAPAAEPFATHAVAPAAMRIPEPAVAAGTGQGADGPVTVPAPAGPPPIERIASARPGATVMATDLHQTDAIQIAALSRSVDLANAQAAKAQASAKAAVKGAAKAERAAFGGGGSALAALNTARSKLGKPYRWGAAGPSAFDCSGLVQWSFKQAGISLPRTSSAQSHVGKPVSRSELRPGDLVFFYTPVSHVGIYIGGNKVVHASTAGQPVKISDMSSMPFHNARRI